MRLLSRAALIVAASFVAVPAAHAQIATSFSIAAGATMPIGSTGDAFDMGFNALLGVGIKPPLAPIGARIEGMYSQMMLKDDPLLAGADVGTRTLAGIANITLSGAGMAVPMGYLIGGLGLYNNGCAGSSCGSGASSETDMGFNVGVGLNIPLTGFGTFVEARLHVIMNEGEKMKFIPITFGMKF
jgi:hypothetical protein